MVDDDMMEASRDDEASVVRKRTLWYRQPGTLAAVALALAAVIAGVVFTSGRADEKSTTKASSAVEGAPFKTAGPGETIQKYIKDNKINSTQVRRGDPGVPVIGMGIPPGWPGLGSDTPPWSYGTIEYAAATDPNDPPTIDVLLFKLTGSVDPAKLLEYAPGELQNLPDYKSTADPNSSKLSGFDAVQLAGTYTRDGKERTIAQKTVVIPSRDAVYLLQINVDALPADAEAVMYATSEIDERTTITP